MVCDVSPWNLTLNLKIVSKRNLYRPLFWKCLRARKLRRWLQNSKPLEQLWALALDWRTFESAWRTGSIRQRQRGGLQQRLNGTVGWCWGISPYNWWISWVGKVQWPQTQKKIKTRFVHTKQLSKELKDELQKKADASKFGSLFSNITPVVVLFKKGLSFGLVSKSPQMQLTKGCKLKGELPLN